MGIKEFLQRRKLKEEKLFNDEESKPQTAEIRLIYVKMKNYKSSIMEDTEFVDRQYYISSCFKAPEGMSITDACRVLSFATKDSIKDNKNRSIEGRIGSITYSLVKNYNFTPTHLDEYNGYFTISNKEDSYQSIQSIICNPIKGVTDLFIVRGNKLLFSRSPLGKRYFEWFNPNITREDVDNIYQKIGIHLNQIPSPALPQTTEESIEPIDV